VAEFEREMAHKKLESHRILNWEGGILEGLNDKIERLFLQCGRIMEMGIGKRNALEIKGLVLKMRYKYGKEGSF
jgi:hypothetical protein